MRTAINPDDRLDLYPVGTVVHGRVQALQQGYLRDDAAAVADLARLRKGAGKTPGNVPGLWGLTYRPDNDFEQFERAPTGEKEEQRAELAIHVALTLFALHQQSHRENWMHQASPRDGNRRTANRDLGWAVRRLMPADDVDERLRQRFVHLCTATTSTSLAVRLRGIVQLLRRAAVPLDYGLLADQLMQFHRPGGPTRIRRVWGRSFVTYRSPDSPDSAPGGTPDSEGTNTNTNDTANTAK